MFLLFSRENVGKIRVFSIKVALATMCAGKLMDKWRCECSHLFTECCLFLEFHNIFVF